MKIKKFDNDTQVLIGQPKVYPDMFVLEMKNFYNLIKSVKKAYIACIQYPDPGKSFKLLVGIEGDNLKTIVSQLEVYLGKKKFKIGDVDFINSTQNPFQSYFLKIKPFYEKN